MDYVHEVEYLDSIVQWLVLISADSHDQVGMSGISEVTSCTVGGCLMADLPVWIAGLRREIFGLQGSKSSSHDQVGLSGTYHRSNFLNRVKMTSADLPTHGLPEKWNIWTSMYQERSTNSHDQVGLFGSDDTFNDVFNIWNFEIISIAERSLCGFYCEWISWTNWEEVTCLNWRVPRTDCLYSDFILESLKCEEIAYTE